MAMSRKHYREAAEIIKRHRQISARSGDNTGVYAVEGVAEELADMFKRDNSAFDRARFMEACGIDR